MTCREFTEFLDRYLSSDLAPEERREFDRHLAVCRPCQDYLDGYQRTAELGSRVLADEDGPVPEDSPEELIQAILAALDRADPKD